MVESGELVVELELCEEEVSDWVGLGWVGFLTLWLSDVNVVVVKG